MSHHGIAHGHAGVLPQLLKLDSVLHASVITQAIDTVSAHAADADVTKILDMGAGTGAGTFALAARYPAARVIAVDVDEQMLASVRHRAEDEQSGNRIRTLRLDIAEASFDAGDADVIWSSNAMHEVSDPAASFRNLFASLRRGGVLIVIEMDAPPTVLPAEHALLESTLRSAAGADAARPEWADAIAAAGFELLEVRTVTSDQVLPADGPGGAYAALELRRLAQHAMPALTANDVAELRDLVLDLSGPHERLDHVHIRGTRTLWAARRP